MLILIGVSTSFVDHSIYGVLALAFVGSYLITIVMPLYKARLYVTLEQHPSTTSDDDSLTIDSYNTGTTKADYKSLEGVMAEPKLLESFSMFVAKHFKVEMIYFLIQVKIATFQIYRFFLVGIVQKNGRRSFGRKSVTNVSKVY